MDQIAVLGANGHTGRFVVAELKRRGQVPVRAVRSGQADRGVRELDFSSTDSLDRALDGTAAVINCAGPFLDTAEAAARAAIRAGIPYLDVSAEQMAVVNLLEAVDDEARASAVTIVPAMAFYGGLADLLATALVQKHGTADRIEVGIALDGWHPTAGTRRTGARNAFPRMIVEDWELVVLPAPAATRNWYFEGPFGDQPMTAVPFSEIILMHRHLGAREIANYLNDKALADVRDPATPPPTPADDRNRSSQQFMIEVRIGHGSQRSRATCSGKDIYAITAPLIVSACLELVAGRGNKGGVRAPGELFDPVPFLSALAPDLVLTLSSGLPAVAPLHDKE